MDKQAQDKRWNELSEESQREIRMAYEIHKPICAELIEDTEAAKEVRLTLENLFGEHNINPNPKKKEGWVNVYYPYDGDRTRREVLNKIFSTKKEAETGKDNCLNYIASVKIEWEE